MAEHLVVKTSSVSTDALVRAWRTFYTAIGVDILGVIGLGLSDLMGSGVDVRSGAFWAAVGLLVLKSVLMGVATFLVRLKVTPKNEKDLPPIPEGEVEYPDGSRSSTLYSLDELGTQGLESAPGVSTAPASDYDAQGRYRP